jgi:catechol 2,3-dioxygenase-like lactoylglutathione lyase family enzyme
MADRSFQITIDCADPDRLARFWAEALGYDLEEPPGSFDNWRDYWISIGVPPEEAGDGGYDSIVDPEGVRPRVWFQVVPESKSVKNRLHFDVRVGGGRTVPLVERRAKVEAEAARLGALGAEVRVAMNSPEIDHFYIGMADPEGNEFDVV